jgi:dTDP-4-dehydrorhamnose reductase
MKKLLITGASGFLGWHLGQQAKTHWHVYGTYATHPVEISGVILLPLDLRDFPATQALFQNVQPDAVIHCAAQSSPNWCQLNPDDSYAINVLAAWNLAGLCADANIPCAFTSTDLVFDGLNPPYSEPDPVCPVNLYGEQKVAAETGMRSRYPQTAICRMPLMFGVAPTAPSFLQPCLETLRAGKPLKLFTDEFRTPASGVTAAQGLLFAVENLNGVIHLGGKERLSRYEFGSVLADVIGVPQNLVQACMQADILMSAPRPKDVSLNSAVAFGLGYHPLSVKAELLRLRDQL